MATVFSDIFEAIRILRQKKGAKEADIMTYVHDRLGKGVSIRTVLKTLKTLNRLVDDGLLSKNGGRFLLPLPPGFEDQEESDAENGDDCMDVDNDQADEGEDEDDEDDDDDDDDDHKCNLDDENMDDKGKKENNGKDENNCNLNEDVEFHEEREDTEDWDYGHIDKKMKKSMMRSELNPAPGTFTRSKKYSYRARRNRSSNKDLFDSSQSRLPMRKTSNDSEMDMEDFRESDQQDQFINHDLAFDYEQMDTPDCYEFNQKNLSGSSPLETPRIHLEGIESCCSEIAPMNDNFDNEKSNFPGCSGKSGQSSEGLLKKQISKDRQGKSLTTQDGGDENCNNAKNLNFDNSENSTMEPIEKRTSICELCKKKKLPEYDTHCPHNAGNW